MTGIVSPARVPRYTLREAEAKILNFDDTDATSDVNLRRAFVPPPTMCAEDVFVQRELCLWRKAPHEAGLGPHIAALCVSELSKYYNCPSQNKAKMILKVYVCEATLGNKAHRIFATEVGTGLVRLTLAWCLALADGTVVLDGGRYHQCDHHMFGLGDMFGLANAERTLDNMAKGMCSKILKQTDIPSRYGICGCMTTN